VQNKKREDGSGNGSVEGKAGSVDEGTVEEIGVGEGGVID
jgi:hypothetical protein